jgi:CubicO group peptidase (beta-lactamase class C family)
MPMKHAWFAAAAALAVAPSFAQNAPVLEPVEAAMKALVDDGQLAGVATIAYQHGVLIHSSAVGVRDLASGAPMRTDTIVRAFSMTKPVTAAAMMILYDEGKWRPEDPIAKHLPELADLEVITGADANGAPVLAKPESQPTIGQLMTHTAGFSYGFTQDPVDALYQKVNPLGATSAKDFVARLAKLPLAYEPGTQWRYSVSMDVEGAIVERLSGKTLPEFMDERIFGPLGMKDTGFMVPAEKRERFATMYTWTNGALAPAAVGGDYSTVPGFASGGGGLVTTAEDYVRFARMLLRGGLFEDVRVLSEAADHMIRTNHIADEIVNGGFGIGFQRIRPGYQFGYNGVVVTDPAAAGVAVGKGSYLWDGAAGTWFWVDPQNGFVFVGMVQRLMSAGGMPQIQEISQKASWPLIDGK